MRVGSGEGTRPPAFASDPDPAVPDHVIEPQRSRAVDEKSEEKVARELLVGSLGAEVDLDDATARARVRPGRRIVTANGRDGNEARAWKASLDHPPKLERNARRAILAAHVTPSCPNCRPMSSVPGSS